MFNVVVGVLLDVFVAAGMQQGNAKAAVKNDKQGEHGSKKGFPRKRRAKTNTAAAAVVVVVAAAALGVLVGVVLLLFVNVILVVNYILRRRRRPRPPCGLQKAPAQGSESEGNGDEVALPVFFDGVGDFCFFVFCCCCLISCCFVLFVPYCIVVPPRSFCTLQDYCRGSCILYHDKKIVVDGDFLLGNIVPNIMTTNKLDMVLKLFRCKLLLCNICIIHVPCHVAGAG